MVQNRFIKSKSFEYGRGGVVAGDLVSKWAENSKDNRQQLPLQPYYYNYY